MVFSTNTLLGASRNDGFNPTVSFADGLKHAVASWTKRLPTSVQFINAGRMADEVVRSTCLAGGAMQGVCAGTHPNPTGTVEISIGSKIALNGRKQQ